jgi:hypothetical protein
MGVRANRVQSHRMLGHRMTWTAHYFDPQLNRDAVTRGFGSKDDALTAACDLIHRKCMVHFIQGPENEKIHAAAITAWCKAHKTRERPAPWIPPEGTLKLVPVPG